MKNKILLVILLSLTSCKIKNSSSEESLLTTSFDVFSYYQNSINKLNDIYEKKKLITSKNNHQIEEYTSLYWNIYIEMISLVQNKLEDEKIKEYFISQLGKEKVDELLNIDIDRIFYNKEYSEYDFIKINELINNLKYLIENNKKYSNVLDTLYDFLEEYNVFLNSLNHVNILSDLYLDNSYYQDEEIKMEKEYVNLANSYKDIFKSLLINDKYNNLIINEFSLSESDVNYFITSISYQDDVLELFEKETELENKYFSLKSDKDKIDLYLSLVEIRKEIASKLGYTTYLEYVYKEIYNRNYTINDVSNLIENIKNNKELRSKYLYYCYLTNDINSYRVNEIDLVNNLDYVSEFIPEAEDIIKEFKTYGFYNFDYRSNKYQGSYKTYIDSNLNDQFILLNVDNNLTDYLTLFHEFGHYLGGKLEKTNLRGNKFDLDIAEVQSQGLEYIMSSYYHLFLDEKEKSSLEKSLIFNALWTIYSSLVVTEFENYVYTFDINKEILIDKFDDLIEDNLFPFSFGMNNNHYLFTNISHIYSSPSYYSSYLTSIIPSLVLYMEEDEDLKLKQYKSILEYGTSNDFVYVLNQVNLPTPFEKEAIDIIGSKIKRLS